jgi:hypothetical protein
MAQTAVEWFIEQLPIRIINMYQKEIEKAKQMEKDQSEKIRTDAILNYKCKYCGGEDKGQ